VPGLLEKALDIAQVCGAVVVVVHQSVVIVPRRGSFIDDFSHDFEGGTPVTKPAGYFDGRFLHCAVDARAIAEAVLRDYERLPQGG